MIAKVPTQPCEYDCRCQAEGRRACGHEYRPHGHPEGAPWYCTRPLRHDGDHVACGVTDHAITRWPRFVGRDQ